MADFRYTGVPSAELNTALECALADISNDIKALELQALAGVVLGGGYGRGEGGVLHTENGDRLYNDLDFFVFGENAGHSDAKRIGKALMLISEKWKKTLGVEIDFGPLKNLSEIKNVSSTLMYQELRRGWRNVYGKLDLTDIIPELTARELPYTEAVRTLLNRGMGLVFAGEYLAAGKDDADFIVRNMNKCVLGCGDALLLASGEYRWSLAERKDAFAEYAKKNSLPENYAALYSDACRYKLEPTPFLPDNPLEKWCSCRLFHLFAVRKVAAADNVNSVLSGLHKHAAKERSLRNLLRWIVRTHSFRSLEYCMDAPVVSLLAMLYELLEKNDNYPNCPQKLLELWRVFN